MGRRRENAEESVMEEEVGNEIEGGEGAMRKRVRQERTGREKANGRKRLPPADREEALEGSERSRTSKRDSFIPG
eukprot:757121-Hanusia_phi.AAC.1